MNLSNLQQLIPDFRRQVLRMISQAGYGHTGACLSCLDILSCIYFGQINDLPVMRYNPAKAGWDERDYFVLSKWQAAAALYVCLSQAGFFPQDQLDSFGKPGALLQTHGVVKIPGVEQTIGTPGQGLSIANGIALALQLDKKLNRVYVLIDVAEVQNGQIWEAAMTSSYYQLEHMIMFVDHHGLKSSDSIRGVKNVEPIVDKFEACGWKVFHVADGHNLNELLDTIARCWRVKRRPTAIICDTISGKGIPFLENKLSYYASSLSAVELEAAYGESRQHDFYSSAAHI